MATKQFYACENARWIDITDPTNNDMETISREYTLHYELVRDCMQPEHLPKYDFVDDVNFLIIRYYSHGPEKEMATIREISNKIAIFYTKDYLITIHKEPIPFLSDLQTRHSEKRKFSSPEEAVTKILWHTLETFDDPAQRLSEQVDFFENHILLKTVTNEHVESLYYIKRQASTSFKIVMLMGEPINHIRTIPRDDPALQDLKDQHLKISTLYNQVLEDVNNLRNLYMAFAAQKTNDVMKVLTIFSVFFMPLTFIVGIYGMNFEFMPELSKKWGYPGVLVLMAIITIFIYFWFKKRNWL